MAGRHLTNRSRNRNTEKARRPDKGAALLFFGNEGKPEEEGNETLAEREGFEPSERLITAHTISSRAG